MNAQTHFFIAVPIDKEQKKLIHNWVTENKDNLPFKSWVHQEDYHITLAFLGHVDSKDQLMQLLERVREKTADIPPFTLSLKGLDTFGKKDSPRIFWAGIEESATLYYLQKQVFQACKDTGFKLDSKPFRPHITLARRWNSETPFIKPEAFEYTFQDENNPFMVQMIHLYQTHLDRVPKYETIERFALQGEL
ncbi:RNA 2',3'-cyclic phosphodiesterase [uncultured Metabacillus sp.]|uniref:RNA 2',3'-cyclic phosphodiesterase n=1 Tax=uncultured Metabacillus sp. TaxID=2860135 RepID=UPI002634E3DE|nr:RNA 2',3'-cyclic phosphodiesterase [uncultured Metabacillus sp.]